MSEELIAEGMLGRPASHNHAADLVSSVWGSYFHYPEPRRGGGTVLSRASSFAKRKPSITSADLAGGAAQGARGSTLTEMQKVINIRRVSSFKGTEDPRPRRQLLGGGGGGGGAKSRGGSPVSGARQNSGEDSPGPDTPGSLSPRASLTLVTEHPLLPRSRGGSSGRDTPCYEASCSTPDAESPTPGAAPVKVRCYSVCWVRR